jgi:serine protease AprX
MDDAVAAAVQKGKIVICAAGNSGPNAKTIGCPADAPDAITVGATDKSDVIASFSSRGPNRDGTIKPDISAPGKDIVSTRATGIHNEKAIDTYYISMSGTSMATPVVSGAVALMLQKQPNLTAKQVKSILEQTAVHLGSKTPNNDYGYGRISVKNAIDYLSGSYTPSPTPSPTVTPSPTLTPSPTVTPRPTTYPWPTTSPKPTTSPNPTVTPSPGYPGYPYPGYPGYPYPGYPYPGYPYPGYPYPGHQSPYPGYPWYP